MRASLPSLALALGLAACAADPQSVPAEPAAASDPEADYTQAVAIVQSRQLDRYDEAQALFRRVPADHALYPDADAYRQWIDADRLVRAGRTAFADGRVSEALDRLDEALVVPVLGPEAKDSVRVRRHRWLTQTRACREGLTALAADDAPAARAALSHALEGDSAALSRLAQAHLDQLDGGEAPTPELVALGERLQALDPARVAPPEPPEAPDPDEGWEGWNEEGWSDWSDAPPSDGSGGDDADDGWTDDAWDDVAWDDAREAPTSGS